MAACSSISVSRWNSRDARSRCSRRARAAARALSDSAVAWAATVSNPPATTPMKAQTAVLTALPLAYAQYRLGGEHDGPRGVHTWHERGGSPVRGPGTRSGLFVSHRGEQHLPCGDAA